MARVKIEPGGKVIIAVVIVGALLLLFLRVRASVNKKIPPPSTFPKTSAGVSVTSKLQSAPAENPNNEDAAAFPPPGSEPVRIFFDFNRASINRNVYCIFDKIDEMARRVGTGNLRIMVEGNADSMGPSWYNVDLSRRRAQRVADSLSKRLGIPVNRIEVVANGSARPVASNKTPDGRAENRRSEVHVFR